MIIIGEGLQSLLSRTSSEENSNICWEENSNICWVSKTEGPP